MTYRIFFSLVFSAVRRWRVLAWFLDVSLIPVELSYTDV
jgi:hypothetical protein